MRQVGLFGNGHHRQKLLLVRLMSLFGNGRHRQKSVISGANEYLEMVVIDKVISEADEFVWKWSS